VDADPKVSGTIIADQLKLMKDLHGGDIVTEAIHSLRADLREEIEGVLPGSWISTDAAREIKAAVARLLGEDLFDFQRRIVRQGIERTLNTVWRFFMRQLGDEALAKRTPILYSRTFNRGSLELVRMGDAEAQLELEGWPRIPEFDLVGLMSGIETVLTIAGRRGVRVAQSRRGGVVVLTATWQRR
jgi:hypothetical protein